MQKFHACETTNYGDQNSDGDDGDDEPRESREFGGSRGGIRRLAGTHGEARRRRREKERRRTVYEKDEDDVEEGTHEVAIYTASRRKTCIAQDTPTLAYELL